MTLKQQAISGVKWTGLSNTIKSVLQLLQLACLGRILAASDFGLMAIAMVAIGFSQIFADMGISNAIIYKQHSTKEELSSLYWLNIAAGASVFLIVWFVAPTISSFYKEIQLTDLLRLTGAIFLIVPFGQQFQILLQKELQFNALAIIEVSSSVISTFTAIVTAIAGQGVYSLVWGQLAGAVFTAIALMLKGWKKWRPLFKFNIKDTKEYLGFGLYQIGERSINYFSLNLDKLMIGRLLGTDVLGFYSVAYQLVMRPREIISPVFTKVSFPLFSKIQHDDARLRNGYLKLIQVIAFITMPVYFGMYGVSDSFVPVLLGKGWAETIPIFNMMVILGVFYVIANPVGSLLLAKGRADIGFWYNVFALGLTIPAIIAGSHWGIMGVLWGLVIRSAFILFPCGCVLNWILIKLKPINEYMSSLFGPVLIAFAMAVCVKCLGSFLHIDSELIKLCILSFSGAVFYIACVWLFNKNFLYNVISMIRS
jgi:O-antigen/teichoic acid export membrane protein